MKKEELIQHLQDGREIEFSLYGNSYFMSIDYDSVNRTNKNVMYQIIDCNKNKELIYSSLDEVLSFPFFEGINLAQNTMLFTFDFIL